MGRSAGPGPHVYVTDLDQMDLDDDDRHHLARSRRLRDGDALTVCDGAGRLRPARFGKVIEAAGEIVEMERPRPSITIGLTPVKGQRPEWAVQKLTELGVDRIWLLVAERSVVRWEGDRGEGHLERMQRIVKEAGMQSRAPWLPELRVGVSMAAAVEDGPVALADPGGGAPSLDVATVLIGPEGGWSESERERAPARMGLGPTVLRAETAAVAAGVLLTALRAGLVEPS